MTNNQAFLVSYEGTTRNNNVCNPYKAVVHTADEAIATINTWHTYGHHEEFIVVNDVVEKKIRELFTNGFVEQYGGGKSNAVTLRTTGCGCWDIIIRPALADTLEEHNRIYNEQREAAKAMRMAQAAAVKELRLKELNEQKRGWYHVELVLRLSVFNNHGNDYRTDKTFSGNVIANSGMDAYDKAVKEIKNEGFTHRGNIAMLESWAEPTSHGYEFLFLGVKTDDGYSVEKWEEWHKNGEI
jgi:hypothetical protein